MTVLELIDKKLNDWEVSQLNEEGKTKYFQEKYSVILREYALAGEVIENIIVHETLYDSFVNALNSLELDPNFEAPSGVSWDVLNKDFQEFGKMLSNSVRIAPGGYFSNNDPAIIEREDPERIFVQIMTTRIRETITVNNYLGSRGILQKLHQSGLAFNLTDSEKRMLCLIAALFEGGGQNAQQEMLDDDSVVRATAAHELL